MSRPAEQFTQEESEFERSELNAADQHNSEPVLENTVHINSSDISIAEVDRRLFGLSRRNKYIAAALINLIIIWGGAFAFIVLTPDRYISKFTLLIPGAGTGSSLNLDNLGQASTSINSAYSSAKVDPKTNYKAIAASPVVMELAANSMGLTKQNFGIPKIKLIDQTTILEVSLTASDGTSAYKKSVHFHEALETTLSRLRTEEVSARRVANESALSGYRENVDQAQAALLDFQQKSNMVSSEQFEGLVLNVETLKQQRAQSETQLQATTAELINLEKSLKVTSDEAATALKLQNDEVFLSLVDKVAEATTELTEKQAVWGRKHPQVLHSQSRLDSAKQTILNRAGLLTNIGTHQELNKLYFTENSGGSELFQNVIELSAQKSAIASEIESYTNQLTILEDRLQNKVSIAATLQGLERTHQVATAIYVSSAAKNDLGNSDIYASYPMTQFLMTPTKPENAEYFAKPIALAGALMGSILVCLALVISWKRFVLLQERQKRS